MTGREPDREQASTATLTVTLATAEQAGLVTGLLTDAAGRLAEWGIDQWPYPFPEHIVRASIARADTYLAWLDGGPVGTLALYWADPTFWGDQPPNAGYVHRLVVAWTAAGQGLGAQLLDWAAGHTSAQQRRWLRLDCGADNTTLRAFYERQGFRHAGDVEVTVPSAGRDGTPWRASRYQRPVPLHPSTPAVRTAGPSSREAM